MPVLQGTSKALRSVVNGLDLEVVLGEEIGHQGAEIGVVIYQEHSSHYFSCIQIRRRSVALLQNLRFNSLDLQNTEIDGKQL